MITGIDIITSAFIPYPIDQHHFYHHLWYHYIDHHYPHHSIISASQIHISIILTVITGPHHLDYNHSIPTAFTKQHHRGLYHLLQHLCYYSAV